MVLPRSVLQIETNLLGMLGQVYFLLSLIAMCHLIHLAIELWDD